MRFQWDDRKAKVNLRKHGVSFEEASTVFDDRDAVLGFDLLHSDEEDRYFLLGISAKDRPILVTYCYRNDELVRIISARKATSDDQLHYLKR